MQKLRTLLFIFGLFILASCGNSDNSVNEDETNNLDATQIDAEAAENESEESEVEAAEQENAENESDENNNSSVNPSGAKEILEAAADAMNEINGMALEGKTEGKTEGFGMDVEESVEITGIVTLDPYAQHITGNSIDNVDGTSEMEMYAADKMSYFKDDDGWFAIAYGPNDMVAAITGAHFINFAKYSDAFDVSEEDGNYLLSFSASGDKYNEIAFGVVKELWGEEEYEETINMFDDTSGGYQFTIDKESFLVTSLTYDMEFTIAGELTTTDHGTYTYSKFNDVDEVVVPNEVIENAEILPDVTDMLPE